MTNTKTILYVDNTEVELHVLDIAKYIALCFCTHNDNETLKSMGKFLDDIIKMTLDFNHECNNKMLVVINCDTNENVEEMMMIQLWNEFVFLIDKYIPNMHTGIKTNDVIPKKIRLELGDILKTLWQLAGGIIRCEKHEHTNHN